MKLDDFTSIFPKLPGAMPIWHGTVNAQDLYSLCEQVKQAGGKLVSLWGSDETEKGGHYALHVSLLSIDGMLVLTLTVDQTKPAFPDLSVLFPAANRMQRSVTDMLGLHPTEAGDQRKWLRHSTWPDNVHPLRKSFDMNTRFTPEEDNYSFVTVTGKGVHEIAVGPVHAGTIEPGHFRFSVVGERVLKLEERLGYKHKGIEKRFEYMTLQQGAKLAGRISGDTTVGYAWAYAQAVESATLTTPPPRALWLRALFLELERLLNHIGDLGYLGNDAALAFGFIQFWILKEDLLRMNGDLFGHRYLMDRIVPGGVTHNLDNSGLLRISEMLNHIKHETGILKDIYDEHAGVQDRFLTTGFVAPDLAAQLGLTGLAGRASGQAWDARAQFPCIPYDQLDVQMATHRNGDVAARVTMRFEEIFESVRLIRLMLEQLPAGELSAELGNANEGVLGIGWVEGWRGEIMVALHVGENNRIHRLHPHDPSWQNWPVLEHAIMDNIVPDFPLINKSFNLSYSGVDL